MSEYKDVLLKWAEENFGSEASKITGVNFIYDPGYYYSEYTQEDPSCHVELEYVDKNGNKGWQNHYTYDESTPDLFGLGTILQQLFAIAEREKND